MKLSTVKKRAQPLAGAGRALSRIDAAGITVCIAASLGMYFAVLSPLIQQRPVLGSYRQQLTSQSEKCSELKASMLTLKNHLAVVQEELAQSENKLESANQINQRIAHITAFLTDCELQVDQIQIAGSLAGLRCDLVPIGITGKAGYRQCVAFLHWLHRTFPDITLARFELRGNPARPEQPATFRFKLFWVVMSEDRAGKDMCSEISVCSDFLS